ncbi:MAG: phosphoglycerol geranylgeranyltransferase [Bacteroidales bacterium]|jgi:putative glycerol-1-phosphate prenyltransferase|nr:phosphoglycerol geranylgeranyltransferase [Bacteroidales bacterium]MDD3736364.1 phosphoglycerol geranylgeranyltransferase [Bacteroidales bacterium]NLD63465.1 phosphoglycerol geranylgeranyltransferase [Bacteroidales bacterium]HNT93380.1 phosphoglycerol geranylgeranyltransferase [Bacteroidales bacterium]HOO66442.1 phosphoglycerol geranylgeranyltransferase [Bacteroidales bacterium]
MRIDIPWRTRKVIAQLIDPDHADEETLSAATRNAAEAGLDLFLAGGSLTGVPVEGVIRRLKQLSAIPVVLFPGNLTQLTAGADALFLLSLISGRNPELLIGNHVIAAPFLKDIRDRVIPVGYMLISCGGGTSVEYMSQTSPIPSGKNDIAVATALAGEMLGMKAIYLEGGSGASRPVDLSMIEAVKEAITIPLITGGGIDTAEKVEQAFRSGADMVVIGNGCEHDPGLIKEACRVRDRLNSMTAII